MSAKIYSVSAILAYLKKKIADDYLLTNINVEGEIGNFTNHSSGHWYFTLKDNTGLINCCMFRTNNVRVEFLPKSGDKVIVTANASIFERSGQLQLVVTSMKMAGAGDFYVQFELMKQKLAPLGYFDEERKKKIPQFPQTIAIVTGANTAALQDILITIGRRWPIAELKIHNAIVQGQQAPASIISALKEADKDGCDVMILARGGGAVDDLWCFNDEGIARTIFELKTPIVTGIGHEIDFTIADLVADRRCATPTAAAQYVTPDFRSVKETLTSLNESMIKSISAKLQYHQQQCDLYYSAIQNYRSNISNQSLKLDNLNSAIASQLRQKIADASNMIDGYGLRVLRGYETLVTNNRHLLSNRQNMLKNALNGYLISKQNSFSQMLASLDGISPIKTMQRGYSLVYSDKGLIRSVDEIEKDSNVRIRVSDGSLNAKVISKEKM